MCVEPPISLKEPGVFFLMESGVSYDIDVEITNEQGEKVLVPFSSLSKSGKIVNAYNALLMAKDYEKKKSKN